MCPGILILTSNRVGIFDEAFRSRIQLSLKYNKLDEGQRQQIWRNFVERLDNQKNNPATLLGSDGAMEAAVTGAKPRIGVNTKEISDHITALAKRELNGRQIRNIISTARKLATYRNQPLCYEHLQKVIDEADKFEKYIVDLHRGIPDDDLEYSNGVRGP